MKNFFIIFLLIAQTAISQNPDIKRTWHWYWGHKGGMDFSNGNMIYDSSCAGEIVEANAVISDTAGNLFFYTDGDSVWNKYHQVMQNGTGLMGHYSSIQGTLIVPHPCNDSLYYIFTADRCYPSFYPCNGLRYSIVNVKANGGGGQVTIKNIPLLDTCTECIAATLHANEKYVWVVSQKRRTNEFYLFLVDCNGISLYSTLNLYYTTSYHQYGGADAMVFSPNGKWFAHSYYCSDNLCDTVALLKFDNSNGQFTKVFKWSLIDNIEVFRGVSANISFSNDSKYLYLGTIFPLDNIHNYIYRYTITEDTTILKNSREIIYKAGPTELMFCSRITPNNKIMILNGNLNFDSILVLSNINWNEHIAIYKIKNNSKNGQEIQSNDGWYTFPNFISSYFRLNNNDNTPSVEPSYTLAIPNIFTPNNDHTNDFFSIQISGYSSLEYSIYNRWGQLLHAGKKELNPHTPTTEILWNGKLKNEDAPTGTYYYLIKAYTQNQEPTIKKGFFQLLK